MVCGDLSDLCGHIDKSTNHRRDPVKAQQPDAERREGAGSGLRLFFSPLNPSSINPLTPPASVLPVQVKSCDLRIVPFKVGEVEEVYIRLCLSGLSTPEKPHRA